VSVEVTLEVFGEEHIQHEVVVTEALELLGRVPLVLLEQTTSPLIEVIFVVFCLGRVALLSLRLLKLQWTPSTSSSTFP